MDWPPTLILLGIPSFYSSKLLLARRHNYKSLPWTVGSNTCDSYADCHNQLLFLLGPDELAHCLIMFA